MGCKGNGRIWAGQDAAYLRALEAERIEGSGVDVEYYSLNRGANVDPVYGEPTNDPVWGGSNPRSPRGTPQQHKLSWNFCPDTGAGDLALVLTGTVEYVEYDGRNPIVRPEGRMVEYDAILVVAKDEWDCGIDDHLAACIKGRIPKEGDVAFAMGEWWDIVKVGGSGSVPGSSATVGWRMDLKKRSQFTPDRKVEL